MLLFQLLKGRVRGSSAFLFYFIASLSFGHICFLDLALKFNPVLKGDPLCSLPAMFLFLCCTRIALCRLQLKEKFLICLFSVTLCSPLGHTLPETSYFTPIKATCDSLPSDSL